MVFPGLEIFSAISPPSRPRNAPDRSKRMGDAARAFQIGQPLVNPAPYGRGLDGSDPEQRAGGAGSERDAGGADLEHGGGGGA